VPTCKFVTVFFFLALNPAFQVYAYFSLKIIIDLLYKSPAVGPCSVLKLCKFKDHCLEEATPILG